MPGKGSGNFVVWGVLLLLALALGGGLIYYIRSQNPEEKLAQETLPESTTTSDRVGIGDEGRDKVVDLTDTEKDSDQGREMARRKEELGIKKSLDAVVKEKETVKIGDKTVSMSKIIGQIKAKEKGAESSATGETAPIKEENLGEKKESQETMVSKRIETGTAKKEIPPEAEKSGAAEPAPGKVIEMAEIRESIEKGETKYGIHLVLPGENLWKVHLDFLREYFAKKGIVIARGADKPGRGGQSSGVARILKYAERMVYVYNIKDGKLSDNLNLIRPNEKIVVFNISRLDSILKKLDAEKIERVHLDGEKLILE